MIMIEHTLFDQIDILSVRDCLLEVHRAAEDDYEDEEAIRSADDASYAADALHYHDDELEYDYEDEDEARSADDASFVSDSMDYDGARDGD